MSGRGAIRNVIVLGATSAIGEATCRLFAGEGARLLLAGRSADRLRQIAADLDVRGAEQCIVHPLDLDDTSSVRETFDAMCEALDAKVDVVLVFYGMLGDQAAAEQDADTLEAILRTNFTSAAQWCMAAANTLERQGEGVLGVVGSVAGDRGRQSNYVYGAAKAGLGVLVQGIAHKLASQGAHAVLIKPGFVDTPMTAHVTSKGVLWAKPGRVAAIIKDAIDKRRGPIVYAPWFWRWIMYVIRFLPSSVFHRTKL